MEAPYCRHYAILLLYPTTSLWRQVTQLELTVVLRRVKGIYSSRERRRGEGPV